jgi:hypothetical protein
MNFEPTSPPAPVSRAPTVKLEATSSYNALMRIKTLLECVQDALVTTDDISSKIEAFITNHRESEDILAKAASADASAVATREAVTALNREVRYLRSQTNASNSSLQARKLALAEGYSRMNDARARLHAKSKDAVQLRDSQPEKQAAINGQYRRIAEDLLNIYPIEAISGYDAMCYSIRGLYLPSASVFDGSSHVPPNRLPAPNLDVTAAALGHVALLVDRLATKLSVALPYTVKYQGSTSSVFDPITSYNDLVGAPTKLPPSHLVPTPENSPWRVFCLNQRVGPPSKFNWAILLLNTCIVKISEKVGVAVYNPRDTLANMGVLLNGLANGKGEAPVRKAGLVPALAGLNVGN